MQLKLKLYNHTCYLKFLQQNNMHEKTTHASFNNIYVIVRATVSCIIDVIVHAINMHLTRVLLINFVAGENKGFCDHVVLRRF